MKKLIPSVETGQVQGVAGVSAIGHEELFK
jgi:hypothetical protein